MSSHSEEVRSETDDAGIETSYRTAPSPDSSSEEDVDSSSEEDVDMDRPVSPVRIPIHGAEAYLRQLRPISLADLPGNEGGEAPNCAICYEAFDASQDSDNPPAKTECNHIVCKGCLAAWLNPDECKNTCPICRRPLFQLPPVQAAAVLPEAILPEAEDVEPLFIRAPDLLRVLTHADRQMDLRVGLATSYPYFWRVLWTTLRTCDGRTTSISGIIFTLHSVVDMWLYVHQRRLGQNALDISPSGEQYHRWIWNVLVPILWSHQPPTDLTRAGTIRRRQLRPYTMEQEPGIPMCTGRRVLSRLRALADITRPRTTVEVTQRPNILPRLSVDTQESVFNIICGFAFRNWNVSHCAAYWTLQFEELTERHLALVRRAEDEEDEEEDEPRLCDMDFLDWLRTFLTFVVFHGIEDIMSMPLGAVRDFTNH